MNNELSKKKIFFKDFFLPFLIQFLILVVALVIFASVTNCSLKNVVLMDSRIVGGEETSPHLARLVYMFISLFLGFCCIFLLRFFENKKMDDASFWFGIIGGIFLWQSIGECSWHFGIPFVENGDVIINYLPRIEGPSSTMILLPFLVITGILIKNKMISFGMLALILSFAGNWVGHFISIGTYPLVYKFFEEGLWYRISGVIYGIILASTGIINALKESSNRHQKMIWSVVFYFGIAGIPLSFMEG